MVELCEDFAQLAEALAKSLRAHAAVLCIFLAVFHGSRNQLKTHWAVSAHFDHGSTPHSQGLGTPYSMMYQLHWGPMGGGIDVILCVSA